MNSNASVSKCLVLAPHYDDAELGCGATIAKFIREDIKVSVFVFAEQRSVADCEKTPMEEMSDSGLILGFWSLACDDIPSRYLCDNRQKVLDYMIKIGQEFRPDIVLAPSLVQTHQDHRVVAEEAFRAFKYTSLLGYDMPWNNLDSGRLTTFVDVTEEDVQKKVDATACYKSQMPRPYFDKVSIFSLARARGLQCGLEYAEAFETYRWFL